MKYIPIILLIKLIFSWTQYSDQVDLALALSGENQQELEKVLRHYSGDKLKYQAAEYLIRYIPYYSYHEVLPEFDVVFDKQEQVRCRIACL